MNVRVFTTPFGHIGSHGWDFLQRRWWREVGVGGHLSAAMTGSQLQCVRTSKALKTKSILQIIMTLRFNKWISHSSEFDPHVPVVNAVQQIFNKLLVFPVKILNSITICTSRVKHQFKLCTKSLKKISSFYCSRELTEQTQCSSALAFSDLLLIHPLMGQDPKDKDFH